MLRPSRHRNVAPVRQRNHAQRVFQTLPRRHVPRHNGNSPHIQLSGIERQHQSPSRIGCRIGGQDNLFCARSVARRRAEKTHQNSRVTKPLRKVSRPIADPRHASNTNHRNAFFPQLFHAAISDHLLRLRALHSRPGRSPEPRVYSFVLVPTRRELAKATNKIPATTPSHISTEIGTHGSTIIFAPINASTNERPAVKYRNRPSIPAKRKYIARNPKVANTFDVYTIKGSRVIPNTAGIESTAIVISVISTISNTTNKGVANSFPPSRTNNLLPLYSRVTRKCRLANREIRFSSGCISAFFANSMCNPANTRNAPNTYSTQLNRPINPAPAAIIAPRITSAPRIPHSRMRCCTFSSTVNARKITKNRKRLSTLRAFSMTYPVKNSSPRCSPEKCITPSPNASDSPTQTSVQVSASRVFILWGRRWKTPRSNTIAASTKRLKISQRKGVPMAPEAGAPYGADAASVSAAFKLVSSMRKACPA